MRDNGLGFRVFEPKYMNFGNQAFANVKVMFHKTILG